jgi:hypothetical protein
MGGAGVAMALGVGISAYGQWKSAQDQADYLKAKGREDMRAAQFDAAMMERNANLVETNTGRQVVELNRQFGRLVSTQEASISAAGLDIKSLSATEIMGEAKRLADLDRDNILREGAAQVESLRLQAVETRRRGYTSQRSAERAARDTQTAGYLNTFATLLQGGAMTYRESNA